LEEARLGEKTVTIPDVICSPDEFHHLLVTTYPKRDRGGEFALLCCKPQYQDLLLIGPRISSSPKLLNREVGISKVYIRPIQRDLRLEEVAFDEANWVRWHFSQKCLLSTFLLIVYCILIMEVEGNVSWLC